MRTSRNEKTFGLLREIGDLLSALIPKWRNCNAWSQSCKQAFITTSLNSQVQESSPFTLQTGSFEYTCIQHLYHLLLLVGLQFWLLNMATIEICGKSEKHFHTNPTLWIVPELILVISYWKSHSKIWTLLETEAIFLAGFAPIIADNAYGSHFVVFWKLKKPHLKKMWPRYIFIQNYHMSRFQANT